MMIVITYHKFLKNRDYIQTHCNNKKNSFHFAYHQWYIYMNTYTNTSIIISILV